jgi:hypothetical protein
MERKLSTQKTCIKPSKWTWNGNVSFADGFELSNGDDGHSEIIFDYQRAEGGIPFIETSKVTSRDGPIEIQIIFSETFTGLQKDTGMDSQSSWDFANTQQEMDPSSCSRMPWIHTESIPRPSSLLYLPATSSYHTRNDHKDTRKQSSRRRILQYPYYPLDTHKYAHRTPP